MVTAGGSGLRFGSLKQFATLGGSSVLGRAVDVSAQFASAIVVPIPEGAGPAAAEALRGRTATVTAGGATRALSVLAGLRALPEVEWVLIHDAARPFATFALFGRVLEAAARVGAAIPALPCVDTVKTASGELVTGTLDRASLRLVQTPQVFRREALLEAYARAGEAARDRTDDAAVYEALGWPIAWVEGEAGNVKLTRPEDLARLTRPAFRVGVGYDVHPFASAAAARKLVLGGVTFEGEGAGLTGDSDADIVAHAVTDAVLGAAALGDLGQHFPPGDPRFKGAVSLDLLSTAVKLAEAAGYRVGNVDLTLAARRPKIAPKARAMAENLARVLAVGPGDVNVKATTGDGLGFVGREEGIAVHAVVMLWSTAS